MAITPTPGSAPSPFDRIQQALQQASGSSRPAEGTMSSGHEVIPLDRVRLAKEKGAQKVEAEQQEAINKIQWIMNKVFSGISNEDCLSLIRQTGKLQVQIAFETFMKDSPTTILINEKVTLNEGYQILNEINELIHPSFLKMYTKKASFIRDLPDVPTCITVTVSNIQQLMRVNSQGQIIIPYKEPESPSEANEYLNAIVNAERDYVNMSPNPQIPSIVDALFDCNDSARAFNRIISELAAGKLLDSAAVLRIICNKKDATDTVPKIPFNARSFVETINNVKFLDIPKYVQLISSQLPGIDPQCSYKNISMGKHNDVYWLQVETANKHDLIEVVIDFKIS